MHTGSRDEQEYLHNIRSIAKSLKTIANCAEAAELRAREELDIPRFSDLKLAEERELFGDPDPDRTRDLGGEPT